MEVLIAAHHTICIPQGWLTLNSTQLWLFFFPTWEEGEGIHRIEGLLDWSCPQARAKTRCAIQCRALVSICWIRASWCCNASIRLLLVNCFTTRSQSATVRRVIYQSVGVPSCSDCPIQLPPSTTKVAEAEDSSISPPVNGINNNSHSVVNNKSHHTHTVQYVCILGRQAHNHGLHNFETLSSDVFGLFPAEAYLPNIASYRNLFRFPLPI